MAWITDSVEGVPITQAVGIGDFPVTEKVNVDKMEI